MKTLINALITVFPMIFNIQYLHCGCCKGSKGSKTKSTKATEQLAGFKDFTAENLAQDIGGFFDYSLGNSANLFAKNIYEDFNKFIEEYKNNNEAEIKNNNVLGVTWKGGGRPFLILYKDKKYKILHNITAIRKFLNDKEIFISFSKVIATGEVLYSIKSENVPK